MPGPALHDDSQDWHCHVSVSALRFFWRISVVQTTTWKHLKPQQNGLKIQVSLHGMSALRKTNGSIPFQARPEPWSQLLARLRGLRKVSRRAHTICNSYVSAASQAAPAVFQRGAVALLWLLPSAKCWRALKCVTAIVLSETWSIFFCFMCTEQVGICSRWAQMHLRPVGPTQPAQIPVSAYGRVWDTDGATSIGEGKAGCFWCRGSGLRQSAVIGVAGLQDFALLSDSSFCLSCARRKTSDPRSCCFSLYIRQALDF